VWPPQDWTFPGFWLPVNTSIVDTCKNIFCPLNVCSRGQFVHVGFGSIAPHGRGVCWNKTDKRFIND
jgi:hypothetical protein